jgi:hypothetical protein
MVTRIRVLVAMVPLVVLACGAPAGPTSALDGPRVRNANPIALQRSLSEADSVLVGRLVSADRNWYPCSGATSISEAELGFRVVRVLRGAISEKEIVVFHPVLWNSVYFEDGRATGKGLRLASAFFHEGSEYLVLVQSVRLSPGDRERYWPAGDLGFSIWAATPENTLDLERALAGPVEKGVTP